MDALGGGSGTEVRTFLFIGGSGRLPLRIFVFRLVLLIRLFRSILVVIVIVAATFGTVSVPVASILLVATTVSAACASTSIDSVVIVAAGATTATATCAAVLNYARLWFESDRDRYVGVFLGRSRRGRRHELGRRGRAAAATIGGPFGSVQRRAQLDRGLRDGFLQFGGDVQRFHRGTRSGWSWISTRFGTDC